MEKIKQIIIDTIMDITEINHYLEEILVEEIDSKNVVLIAEQIRRNNETMIELSHTYLDFVQACEEVKS